MSSTSKLTKKQEYENFFKRKLLRKHITSQLKDPNFVYSYIDLKKYPLSQVIISKKTLEKE